MTSAWRTSARVLVIIGVLALAVQLWGYGAWVSSTPHAVQPTVATPPHVTDHVHLAELTSVIGAACWLWYVAWSTWRRRGLTWPLLWTLAWTLAYWQEPLVNLRHHTFSFNRAFYNLGDWTSHLPFVHGSPSPLPEALILEGLVFVYLLPLLAMVVAGYLRLLRRLLPFRSVLPAIAIAYLSVVVFDAAFELQGISQGLLRYVEIGGPALNSGSSHQWPLLEGLMIGAAWAFPGIAMFLLRDHWRFPRTGPQLAERSTTATVLAAVGAVNLVFGIYNAVYILTMHGTVAGGSTPWLQ